MTVLSRAADAARSGLQIELEGSLGRYRDKRFDFDAFPSNRGFPGLERGQMRFIGAGGSPKVGDSSTFRADHFTTSLIYQERGRYAAAHSHEVTESFLMFDGVLTVGWELDGEVIEIRLEPRDMIMNVAGVAHGFRNDDVQPILMSVMVQNGKPLPPRYHHHPRDTVEEKAIKLGAERDQHVLPFDPEFDHPLMRRMAANVIRYSDAPRISDPAGFSRIVYIGEGGIASSGNRAELFSLPPGAGVKAYTRSVEDAYFVMDGALTVIREADGDTAEVRLGARDLVLNQPGTARAFRNDGPAPVQFMMMIGTDQPDDFHFAAA